MINIDLEKLGREGLNINEYLTIIKIKKINEGSNLNFYTDKKYLDSLIHSGFLSFKNDIYSLTSKSLKTFKFDKLEEQISEVLTYFKSITKKKIDINSPSNRKFVRDRINQGYNVKDLKNVIDSKYNEWKGDSEMKQYIRIQTLFNESKFQLYISSLSSAHKETFSSKRRI